MATVKNTYRRNKDRNESGFMKTNILVNNNIMGWFSHYAGSISYERQLPISYLPYLLWLVLIGVFYIGIKHDANRTIRQINKKRARVEDLKVDYTTLKADYMYASKQTEVVKKVQPMGLEESMVPMFKLKPKEE